MSWILNNWYIIVAIIAIAVAGIYFVVTFLKLPKEEQIAKVREWLLYAVTIAEKELGSGTGALKLRYVYDMFLDKFPWLVKVISFNKFSELVDEELDVMREILENNKNIKELVVDEEETI